MSDLASQLEGYKHLLKLTEELLTYAGIPEELQKKYDLIKEKTMHKLRTSSVLTDSTKSSSTRQNVDFAITEELGYLFDLIYTSNNTLCEKIISLLNYLTNLTTRSGVSETQRTMYGTGLISDNKSQFYSKLRPIKDSGYDSAKYSDFKQNIEYFMNNQVPRFEKLENKLVKYMTGIEEHILRQNEKVLEMEEIIEHLQRSEQKLKIEIDMLSSRVNDARQIQSIESLERNHDVQSQIQHLKESLRKAENTYDRQVNDLKDYYEGVIGDLQDKIQSIEKNYSMRIDDLVEKDRSVGQSQAKETEIRSKEMEYYQKLVETIKSEFKGFYDKYIATHHKSFDSKQGSKRNKDELFDIIFFVGHLLQKFENDNLWLVDKLTDMGNETENLKTRLHAELTSKEEFDKLFKKLRNELQDSKSAFFDWENSIQGLRKVIDDEKQALTAHDLT